MAATPKQFQRHVLEHERVWWRATIQSFFDWAYEQEYLPDLALQRRMFDIYIPDFDEYLKIIGLCKSCSFPAVVLQIFYAA